jgi:hypothetical protein
MQLAALVCVTAMLVRLPGGVATADDPRVHKHAHMNTSDNLNADFVRREYVIPQTSQSCSMTKTSTLFHSLMQPERDCSAEVARWYDLSGERNRSAPFHAVMIGDSTMFRLSAAVAAVVQKACGSSGKVKVVKRSSGKCGIDEYIGIKDRCSYGGKEFCMTNTHEVLPGPTCYDCSGCDSSLSVWGNNAAAWQCSLEFVSLMSMDTVPPFPPQDRLRTSTKEAGVGTGQNIA